MRIRRSPKPKAPVSPYGTYGTYGKSSGKTFRNPIAEAATRIGSALSKPLLHLKNGGQANRGGKSK